MKRLVTIVIIIILIPVITIMIVSINDQYTKYAMKSATIKIVKEYCNKDIEVTGVEIIFWSFYLEKGTFTIHTDPIEYMITGRKDSSGYRASLPFTCSGDTYIPLRLKRFSREFIPLN